MGRASPLTLLLHSPLCGPVGKRSKSWLHLPHSRAARVFKDPWIFKGSKNPRIPKGFNPKDLIQGSLKTLQLTGRFPAVTLVKLGRRGLGRGSAPLGGLFAPTAGAPSAAPHLLPKKRVGLLLLQHVQLIPFLLRVAPGWCSNLHAGASKSGHGSGVLHNGLPVPIGLLCVRKQRRGVPGALGRASNYFRAAKQEKKPFGGTGVPLEACRAGGQAVHGVWWL